MTGDAFTLQAPYVAVSPASRHRSRTSRPIVALPVPEPYKWRYVSAAAIEQSCPAPSAALRRLGAAESGWMVTERSGEAAGQRSLPSTSAFCSAASSAGRTTSRGRTSKRSRRAAIPHVLVGGKAFHEREEVEAIRAALAAIEWPDDELSVFATLRGPLFADRRRGAARMDTSLRSDEAAGVPTCASASVPDAGGVRRG